MKEGGYLLMVAGVIAIVVAYFLDTTVSSYDSSVVNLGLLQRQMIVLHTGVGSLIAGAVLAGCGSILERMPEAASAAVNTTASLPPTSADDQLSQAKEALRRDVTFNKIMAAVCGLIVLFFAVVYLTSH